MAPFNMNGLQALVDQQRESAKVSEPISAAQVIDYNFVEKARKEMKAAGRYNFIL